jgi:hypothetical protein
MVLITPYLIPVIDDREQTDIFMREMFDVYKSPLVKDYNVLTSINHGWSLDAFGTHHYLSYYMETGATEYSPVYILYVNDNDDGRTIIKKMKQIVLSGKVVDLRNPQTYEETMVAKAMELGRVIGSKPRLVRSDSVMVWQCSGGDRVRFKELFYGTRRRTFRLVQK